MNEQQQAQRGFEAQQVLDNPAYAEAISLLKTGIYDKWKACPVRDKEGQQILLQLAKLADTFEATLQGMIERGKLAQHKIEIDQAREESHMRSFLRRVSNG